MNYMDEKIRATTVICVHRDGQVAMGADGQVTMGQTVIGKATAKKVHLIQKGTILAGIAGATSDGLTLLDRFQKHLEAHGGHLKQAALEFAKSWNTDKIMRNFQAQLAVSDKEDMYLLSGSGDVIIPEHGILSIGSGMGYAIAAARTLKEHTKFDAKKIVKHSLDIAADICVYTNTNQTILTLDD